MPPTGAQAREWVGGPKWSRQIYPKVNDNPVFALTPGEPAGVGPELAVRVASECRHRLCLVGDPEIMEASACAAGIHVPIVEFDSLAAPKTKGIEVLPVPKRVAVKAGMPDAANAGYVLECLRIAAAGCLAGTFAGLVTGPLHKGVINESGIEFTGHTEFLAALAKAATPVMMLASPTMRVALATTHLPLSAVPRAITRDRVEAVLAVLHGDLRRLFGITRPRILVLGLNPHAGEGGHLGREEIDSIVPAVEAINQRFGAGILGPIAADTAFTAGRLVEIDAVLAMYHDQGLPVIKARAFGETVNVTLGLPFVRTSVDHGTAFELVGSGKADSGSLAAAVEMAAVLASNRQPA